MCAKWHEKLSVRQLHSYTLKLVACSVMGMSSNLFMVCIEVMRLLVGTWFTDYVATRTDQNTLCNYQKWLTTTVTSSELFNTAYKCQLHVCGHWRYINSDIIFYFWISSIVLHVALNCRQCSRPAQCYIRRHVGPTSLQYRYFFDVGIGRLQKIWCGYRSCPNRPLLSYLEFCLGPDYVNLIIVMECIIW